MNGRKTYVAEIVLETYKASRLILNKSMLSAWTFGRN